jgi:hypothetical protein
MPGKIEVGYSFDNQESLEKDSGEFRVICYSDINIDNNPKVKDAFIKLANDFVHFLKNNFVGIYYVDTDAQGWNDETGQYLVSYIMKVVIKELREQLYKFNNEFFNSITIKKIKMELTMSTLYRFWSENSLHDELKRRKVNAADHENIHDKDELVAMIEALDHKRKDTNTEKLNKQELLQKKETEKVKTTSTGNGIADIFSKLKTTKDLIDAKKKYGLDCKLFKSLSIEENQDILRKAYEVKKKTETKVSKIEKTTKEEKSSKKSVSGSSKSKKDDKRKKNEKKVSGTKISKDKLPEDYVEMRKSDRRKRDAARRISITPELRAKIDAFKKEYKGKKINWNNKLKKAGLWINGMNFLTNYEKYTLVKASGSLQKKLLAQAEKKIKDVALTISKVNAKKNKVLS